MYSLILLPLVLLVLSVRGEGSGVSNPELRSGATARHVEEYSSDSEYAMKSQGRDSSSSAYGPNMRLNKQQIKLVENAGRVKLADKMASAAGLRMILRLTLFANRKFKLDTLSPQARFEISKMIKSIMRNTRPDSLSNVYTEIPRFYRQAYTKSKNNNGTKVVYTKKIVRKRLAEKGEPGASDAGSEVEGSGSKHHEGHEEEAPAQEE